MDAKVDKTLEITTPSDLEIVMTRMFDAPRHLVFDAMTQPEHVRRWLGCAEMPMTVCEIDLRVGGAYRFTLTLDELRASITDRITKLVEEQVERGEAAQHVL